VIDISWRNYGSAEGWDEIFAGAAQSSAAATGQACTNASAEQFVRGLYAGYTDKDDGPKRTDSMFAPELN
jgi:hypothetical protein